MKQQQYFLFFREILGLKVLTKKNISLTEQVGVFFGSLSDMKS